MIQYQCSYISECGEFDSSVPLCIALRLVSNEPKAVRYYVEKRG